MKNLSSEYFARKNEEDISQERPIEDGEKKSKEVIYESKSVKTSTELIVLNEDNEEKIVDDRILN